MKKILISFAFLLISVVNAIAQSSDVIVGNWYSKELSGSTMHVYRTKSGKWAAQLTASEKKEWIGKILFDDCTFDSKDNCYKTVLAPPNQPFKINTKIYITEGSLTMVGKKLFLSKTFYWIKLNN
ncbi:hypothetical protein GCM10023093_25840 [Nemorincola caseinilytica]|uniref:DUF2147 domain-containing protein n=1 Tax=Nemorincola caseinilytica TaxID=2054315 RepID=A0ABP8NK23_9BACT